MVADGVRDLQKHNISVYQVVVSVSKHVHFTVIETDA